MSAPIRRSILDGGVGRRGATARFVATLVAMALAVSACTTSDPADDPTSTTTIPPAATLLRVATDAWPSCLNPLTCADDPAVRLVLQHVLPVLIEPDASGGWVPSPVLTGPPDVRIEETTGAQVIRYRIDPAARWHDGRPLTSTDVLATWLARLATEGADRSGYERITGIDDSDPLVAEVTLGAPWADWPQLFGGGDGFLLQADQMAERVDLADRFDVELPFGAGPFELVSFDATEIVLLAREDHWNPERQAGVDQVRIERATGLATGEIPNRADVVLPLEPGAEVASRYDRRSLLEPEVVGIFFDRRSLALQSTSVRAAIEAVVDRVALLELVTPVGEEPPALVTCLGWLPSEPACDPEDLPASDVDLAAAEAVLDADGWVRGEDGLRARDGVALAVPLTHDPSLPGAAEIADALRFTLRALGISVERREADARTWATAGREESTGVSVQAVRLGTPGRLDDLYDCAGGPNRLAWCEATAQELLASALAEPSAEDRLAILEALGDRAADELAWLPLHQTETDWFVGAGIVVPESVPLGRGPLGGLWAFTRDD